ncbi:MAG: hypothetical protein HUJ90_02660, partial [Bacteroidales bacterium]|nr:hypothetical protein [Bacteroidales bacterium]
MLKFIKKIVPVIGIALITVSCYNDEKLWTKVNDHESRIAQLEKICTDMNTNISSIQSLVNALQNNDYITSVTPVTQDGVTTGYTINFTKSAPITIYHGKNGYNGSGHTPIIGVKEHIDGILYWTVDDEWLLDENNQKVKAVGTDGADGIDGQPGADGKPGADGQPGADGKPGADGINGSNGTNGADGKDGITPQLKIVEDYWYVSYDNGTAWQKLGKATGEDGVSPDSMFSSINTTNDSYVIFTLANGTEIKIPTWYAYEDLKSYCEKTNKDIASLQTIVNALETKVYVESVQPYVEDGVQVGYTIVFSDKKSVTIKNGKDGIDGKPGADGQPGQDGIDGADGENGTTPVIGVKKDTDGIWYWTVNGAWLLDDNN